MEHGALSVAGPGGRTTAPSVIAHRGAWTRRAEQNTLGAFARAAAIGADGVELDVRRTVDGAIVEHHDARVGGRLVARQSLAELRERVARGQAPLLEEALELMPGALMVDVELKEGGYEAETMAIVARHLAPERRVITSFRDSVLAAVARAAPEARTGLLLGPSPQLERLPSRLEATGAAFLAPRMRHLAPGVLAWAARRELECWVWTVNERRALAQALDAPAVAAVITDRPDRALQLTGRRP